MDEDKPNQLDYANDHRPPGSPWRFVLFIVALSAALVLTIYNLKRPRVGGWIGYLFPVTCLVFIALLFVFQVRSYLQKDEGAGTTDPADQGRSESNYSHSYPAGGTLGIGASTFRGAQVGCVGATFLVIFTVLCVAGLLAMVWWPYLRDLSHQ